MDSELAALAASGATTLASLMVTDSWAHARELVARVLARTGSDSAALADLDSAKGRLVAAGPTNDQALSDITTLWHTHLQQVVETGTVTDDDLRDLVSSLQRLTTTAASHRDIVRNDITGGLQHGPVVQSGRVSGLTFHVQQAPAPDQG